MHRTGSIQRAHSGAIHVVKFNSAGSYLLSGGQDRVVRLWNPVSRKLVCEYKQHGYEVLDIAVTHDDSQFVSVGGDKVAYVWDVPTSQLAQRFVGHESRINSAYFNKHSSILATGSFDTTVKLWDFRSHKRSPIQTLHEAKDSVSSVVMTDTQIISGSVDGKLRIYDLRNYKVYTDSMGPSITAVKLLPEGSSDDAVSVTTLDSTIRQIDVASGALQQSFVGHRNTHLRINHAVAGDYLVSGSEDDRLYVWSRSQGDLIDTIATSTHNHAIDSYKHTVACSSDHAIDLWKV